jgi:uncharacterized protein YlzI (FlbEa/FlbD family)
MIELTRLNRQKLILNADLIKWLETSPDTVITLINGEKMIVLETAAEVVALVHAYRRSLLQGLDFSAVSRSVVLPGMARPEPAAHPDEDDDERG